MSLEESVRHKHEDSKVDLKFLVEDERFHVNQLISKVRNQIGTNKRTLRLITVLENVAAIDSRKPGLREGSMLHRA